MKVNLSKAGSLNDLKLMTRINRVNVKLFKLNTTRDILTKNTYIHYIMV